MAHGNPIYYICKQCKCYILNPRFSKAPICKCGKEGKQISQSELKELVKLPFMSELSTSFTKWSNY